ncbi:GspH/FimT family pseudopilin [Curvibacter sp. CHRR-16]|uniref:GspH/FimT family pseudopilin n=1 Tax=Curvibacter sp. CHRR-16 TaxID=2835872 RepID=UPI001BD9299D|nr:GspH/FimT family pseudopilin [Curvibacter sp. CHRR-16]MBT0569286.1 GspH/FimT family pseudopilin [Curvibacter sp. CHRR-16]
MDLHIKKATTQRTQGFSAIELLIVIGIVVILAALAAPSFSTAIDRYRINSAKDELIAAIQFARMESVRRGVQVSLIRTTGCGATLTDSDDWSCGYQVFVDSNANGSLNTGELTLQTFNYPKNYNLMHTGLGASLRMNIWGLPVTTGQKFVFTPTAAGVASGATTTVCISSGGRLRTLAGEATCQ